MQLENFRVIKTVYSYLLPEVRQIITDLTREYPHDIFLSSVAVDTKSGQVREGGLDDFHESVIEKLISFHADAVPHLGDFRFRYPTSGSQEGIREFMTTLQSQGVRSIYTFKGEYEGFEKTALTRNIRYIEVDEDCNPNDLTPGYWFVSNPSAIHGCYLADGLIYRICEAGHKVFYDLSYLGSTTPHVHNLSHPNIVAATISFSKPYGLFYYRIGFTFSREPIVSLDANKWFKNIFGLLIADKILDQTNQEALVKKYKRIQKCILDQILQESGIRLRPSQTFLLGYLQEHDLQQQPKEIMASLKHFKRAEHYRFCLTPYFLDLEKQSNF